MKGYKSFNQFLQSVKSQLTNPKPSSLLYNRWLLYAVFIVSISQLYTFSVSGNITYVVIFLLVGFITSFFSKNMSVILVIALVFTGLLQYGVSPRTFEGMVESKGNEVEVPSDEDSSANAVKNENETEKEKEKEKVMDDMTKLEKTQEVIVEKFKDIEPYISKAETLVEEINKTTENLKNMGVV